MFAYAFLFDSSKHSRPLRFGNVEPQVFGFQDNAVQPALFSKDNLPPRANQCSGKWFDGLGNVKLAGDGAAFTHEKILANGRLPGLERIAAGALNEFRDFTDFGEVERDGNVIKASKGQSDFTDVGIARAFAHSVDRALDPGSAGADGSAGTRGGHAEVVVAVKMNGHTGAYPTANLTNEVLNGLRATSANRVNDDDFSRTCSQPTEVDPF